jgi:hypothetical protein
MRDVAVAIGFSGVLTPPCWRYVSRGDSVSALFMLTDVHAALNAPERSRALGGNFDLMHYEEVRPPFLSQAGRVEVVP